MAESSRKRRHVVTSSDEDEPSQASPSTSPIKRSKVIRNQANQSQSLSQIELNDSDLEDLNSDDEESEERSEGDGVGDEDGMEEQRLRYRPEYERGDDGYVAGSITRIKMTNFMTYDHVEFKPGPHLNMILGPNGTGKSSIAAAIAIGLGFPPKVMGRANELKAYVKQGADQAMVEIELKGRRSKRNMVVWRKFNREDEKSEWKLDGETTTRREVLDKVQKSGIQANNLCSFLPQDKVAEFAKMAPVAVLKETMRAAGDPRLTKWHENLVEYGSKIKEVNESLETRTATRDRLQTQVDGLAPDVAHVQEREAREKEAEVLEHLVRVKQHEELKQARLLAAKEYEALQMKADNLQSRRKPLQDLNEHWEKKTEKSETRLRAVEEKVRNGMRDIRQKHSQAEDVASRGRQVDDQLGQLRTKHQRREDEKRSLRDKIQTAQRVLDEPREELDATIRAKNRERNDLTTSARQQKARYDETEDEWNDSKRMLEELNQELTQLTARQGSLENIEIQRENAAREFNPSVAYLLDWLAKEGHTLEAEVFKPPMISVSVAKREYASQVEACTSVGNRLTFVCTSQRDYDRLLDLNGRQYLPRVLPNGRRVEGGKVSLNLAYIEVNEGSVNPPRPCSTETLRRLGCDGFAIDFVEAPPAVIAFLCLRSNMHQAAVSARPLSGIDGDGLAAAGVRAWYASDRNTRAVQSGYGRRAFVQSTAVTQPAKAFNLSVDRDAVKRIADDIASKKKLKLERESPHAQLKNKLDSIRDDRDRLREQMNELERDVREMSDKIKRYQRAATDIENYSNKLKQLEKEPSLEEARAKLKAEKLKYAQTRIKPLAAWQTSCDEVLDYCAGYVSNVFTALQSSINSSAISDKLNEGTEETKRILAAVEEAKIKRDDAKLRMVQKFDQIKRHLSDAPQEVREAVKSRSSSLPPLADLQISLQTLRAQLELAINIPGNVVARYNNLMRQLDDARKVVASEEEQAGKLRRDIKKTLDLFDPALEELVSAVSAKFSAAFARVRCSGEVRIRRVEGDFSAWGLEILVSYRDGDSLAILTGSHQSGGERSLATVTYLMSLSEMSRTPFSLVDEINQGMDQRAERAVHNQLVEVTCDTDAGQYFLITPKLLTGLTYHPKMKVLIINNGTHLPDSRDKSQRYGDFNACLKRYAANRPIPA